MKNRCNVKKLSAIAILFAGPVFAGDADVTTIGYLCDHGARVEATYINAGEASFAVVAFEGRQLGFVLDVAGSGARYVSADPAQAMTWWTKADTASLSTGPEGSETSIYQSCTEAP